MKIISKSTISVLIGLTISCSAIAGTRVDNQTKTETEIQKIETGKSIYEDKIDISYLSKMVIHPKDDWIGKKVFKYNDTCIEVIKDLNIKVIDDPFADLYRSANLPDKVEIGVMKAKNLVVDCSLYESEVTVLE